MLAIFLKTLPFFALIGLGFAAVRLRFFSDEATVYLTRFVFYFALSAMLFGFAANLDLSAIFSWGFVLAYLTATLALWALVLGLALWRGLGAEVALFQAHAAVIGNVGFLGIPMLVLLMGPQAVGPVLMVLAIDLVVFSTLLTLILTGLREGQVGPSAAAALGLGLIRNPMIVSVVLGLGWGATGAAVPRPLNEFLTILGQAATPCALFAIGASLAGQQSNGLSGALWPSAAKLVLHPAAVALAAFVVFTVDPFAARVMVAAAALPVAGNVFILARHYGVAPERVSAAILVSTALSIVTVTLAMALLEP